jgi:hypothetical protein
MKTGKAFVALSIGALLCGAGGQGCANDSAQPGPAPGACASSLSPQTATICNGTSVILTLSGSPPAGTDIAWESDFGSLAHADDKAVFTAPSSGSGTTRIRVRWPGPCDLTSYVAYEPCDSGAASRDASADEDASADASADEDASADASADANGSANGDGEAAADSGLDGSADEQ